MTRQKDDTRPLRKRPLIVLDEERSSGSPPVAQIMTTEDTSAEVANRDRLPRPLLIEVF